MKQLTLFLLIVITFTACTKEVTGPAGPAGTPGNANVNTHIYSGLQWIHNGSEYDLTINAANVTQDIVDKGTVFAYFTPDNGATWVSTPITLTGVTVAYTYAVGKVYIAATGGSTAPNATIWKIVTVAGN